LRRRLGPVVMLRRFFIGLPAVARVQQAATPPRRRGA
jgi:hypothetical protein